MARAIRLARRGRYTTHPNPRVGCVLVNSGQVVGEGFHLRAGMPHAEVNALHSAGTKAGGATAYITLEPCCHHGRTGPCTDALIGAGVARVVVAMNDPNPQVAGKGLRRLREAGIEVEIGILKADAKGLNPGFISRMRHGRPWVRLKMAVSMDGRTAMASGESQWITGEAARRDVQYLRAASSAILTGSATVVADDPSLNVRLSALELGIETEVRQPLRVVLDTRLIIPLQAGMFKLPGPCMVITSSDDRQRIEELCSAGAEVLRVRRADTGVHLGDVMRALASREVNELHVETGATLAGALAAAGLVDEFVVYMAAHLMGNEARGLVRLQGLNSMNQRMPLKFQDVRMVGDDLRIIAIPGSKSRIGPERDLRAGE
ncbi:MAG: bifunctional diaminohydroxyphosphoribosylaminopyrimidine deaminase/5-amino-6-(5-phosphoribosylamino)uracil reductase RibD [Gammaproteobacteria bacterium]|nr:bifunctional diaminohydroxyphosphoribosylaminopyrimidine deaminase/5-amino-6-(5-phosphoribosylamino)uracil reductase RibD [Gammaproteobacteria bacterium]